MVKLMTLKTLGVALDVLSLFTKENPEWGLRELSRKINLNHTVVHRILKTYESKGFLSQDSFTKKYELGTKLFDLLSAIQARVKLSDLVLPIMEELSLDIKESVFLTWREGFDGVTVEISESSQQIKFAVTNGTKTPLYVGASCKVIMAFLDVTEQLEVIKNGTKKYTNKTLVEKDEIIKNLEQIKELGWCYSEGEFSEDVFGIGVPIFNKSGRVLGSITIAGPIYRINQNKRQEIIKKILDRKMIIDNYIQLLDVELYR